MQVFAVIISDVLETNNPTIVIGRHDIHPILSLPPIGRIFHITARKTTKCRDIPARILHDDRLMNHLIGRPCLCLCNLSWISVLNFIDINRNCTKLNIILIECSFSLGNLTGIACGKCNGLHLYSTSGYFSGLLRQYCAHSSFSFGIVTVSM
ncbi:hypothetical protein D3C85_1401040 [compost metagenome]